MNQELLNDLIPADQPAEQGETEPNTTNAPQSNTPEAGISPQEQFLMDETSQKKIDEVALKANEISDPEERKAFILSQLKEIEKEWHNKYSQKRQMEVQELEQRRKELEENSQRALIEAYQKLITQAQTPQQQKTAIDKLREIVSPEIAELLEEAIMEKTKDLQQRLAITEAEKQLQLAEETLRQQTQNTPLPYDQAYPLMAEWWQKHPEYQQSLLQINNPALILQYIYNEVYKEKLPSLLEQKKQADSLKNQQGISMTAVRPGSTANVSPPDPTGQFLNDLAEKMKPKIR